MSALSRQSTVYVPLKQPEIDFIEHKLLHSSYFIYYQELILISSQDNSEGIMNKLRDIFRFVSF